MANQLDLFTNENAGAIFSESKNYRYVLWRKWDETKPAVMFIGLNPSTANENEDDPTIRRVKRFAFDWGFGTVYMLNLFAYVTAYPEELKKCNDPIGDNDNWLKEYAKKSDQIVFSWGSFSESKERAIKVIEMFPNSKCLVKNRDGSPKHPLYISASIKLQNF